MVDISASFAGLKLNNPIIVGSSGLTDHVDNIIKLGVNNAAAIVLKSIFEEEIRIEIQGKMKTMSSNSFLYPETLEFIEQKSSNPESAETYLNLIENTKRKIDIPVIASINCVTAEQWTYYPKQIETTGADALELNIFQLPSDFNKSSEENEKIYFQIIEEVTKQLKIPVIIKLSYYFSNLASFLKKLSSTGIKGLVLFNRFYNPDIDIEKLEITSGAVLSNPADLYLPLRWIAILSNKINCNIAASTGIHDGKSLIKLLLAGASAVQIVSTIYKNGPGIITTMLDELKNWMKHHNFSKLTDFQGKMSQSDVSNTAAFERVQFMKYFRNYKK